jgi:hypothetical protein
MNWTLYAADFGFPSHPRQRARPLAQPLICLLHQPQPVRLRGQRKEINMRRLIVPLMLVSFAGVPAFINGCDTVEHSKSTEVKDDGTVVKKETKTQENPDGSVTKTEKKDVDRPNGH